MEWISLFKKGILKLDKIDIGSLISFTISILKKVDFKFHLIVWPYSYRERLKGPQLVPRPEDHPTCK